MFDTYKIDQNIPQHLFQRITDALETGIIITSVQDTIIYMNTLAQKIFSINDTSIFIEKNIFQRIFTSHRYEEFLPTHHLELKIKDSKQTLFISLKEISYPEDNHVNYHVYYIRDITAEKELENEITALRCELLHLSNKLDDISLGDQLSDELQKELDTKAAENEILKKKLEELSITDSLTGFYNRRYMQDQLERLFSECNRYGQSLTCLMLDLDNFKHVNDTYGHPFGDFVLKKTAEVIKECIRKTDIAIRYGGEEFAILLPHTDFEHSAVLAQRILNQVRKTSYIQGNIKHTMTLSMGAASLDIAVKTPQEFISRADQALYVAKKTGKDKVVGWSEEKNRQLTALLQKENSERFQKSNDTLSKDIKKTFIDSIYALIQSFEAKDNYTKDHSHKVSRLSESLAQYLALSRIEVETICISAMLHDLGKIGINESIFFRRGLLSNEERDILKRQSIIGYNILNGIRLFKDEAIIIRHCHEHFDGGGYPDNLKSSEIPFGSRIITICEVFDIITSGRHYRPALDYSQAFLELQTHAGTQFDPELIDPFIDMVRKNF